MSDELLASQLRVLRSHAQIVGVHYNELRAKAEHADDDELDAPVFRLGILIEDTPSGETFDRVRFHVSLNVEVTIPPGTVSVEPTMTFEVPAEHASAVNHRAVTAYVNDAGIVHILPFVRQALLDMSTRVFQSPVVMPIFGPDDLQFELPPVDEGAAAPGATPESD